MAYWLGYGLRNWLVGRVWSERLICVFPRFETDFNYALLFELEIGDCEVKRSGFVGSVT